MSSSNVRALIIRTGALGGFLILIIHGSFQNREA